MIIKNNFKDFVKHRKIIIVPVLFINISEALYFLEIFDKLRSAYLSHFNVAFLNLSKKYLFPSLFMISILLLISFFYF